jgi:hypothetical protein
MASQLPGTLHLDIQPASPHAPDGVTNRRQDARQGGKPGDRNDGNPGPEEHIPDRRQHARCMRTHRTTVRPVVPATQPAFYLLTARNQPALLALEARFNPACQRAERPLQRTR